MSMLHIVNKSPFERNSLNSCLEMSKSGSAVLLIEDAVIAARAGTVVESQLKEALKSKRIYVLGPDLEARAVPVQNLLTGIEVVDYSGFVTLTVEHENVQSWL